MTFGHPKWHAHLQDIILNKAKPHKPCLFSTALKSVGKFTKSLLDTKNKTKNPYSCRMKSVGTQKAALPELDDLKL